MERLHRSTINIVSGLIGWAVPMGFNFGATPLLVHSLGTDGYGLQNMVAVVVGYFVIMDMGLDIASVKFLAEYHAHGDTASENRLLSTSLQVYAVVGIIGMLAMLVSAEYLATRVFQIPAELREEAAIVFQLGALGFFANMLIAWGGSVPQGLQRYDIVHSISIANTVAGVSFGLASVYAGYGVIGYVLAKIIVSVFVGIACFFIIRRLLPQLQFQYGLDWEMLRRVGGVAIYGTVLRITGILTTTIDRTLIGIFLGTAAVAFYTIPNLAAMSLVQLIIRLMNFLFPMASELSSIGQYDTLRDILVKSSRFIAAVSTIVFVPVFVLADFLLSLWVGPEIADQSTAVFRVLLIASYLASLAVLPGSIVPGMGYFRQFTTYTVIKGLVIAAGCLVLIRPIGIAGAGVAIWLGSVIDVVFLVFSLRRYVKVSITRLVFEAYLQPMALGIILAGLSFLARPLAASWLGMGLVLCGLGLVFVSLAYATGIFGETEKRALLRLIRLIGNTDGSPGVMAR